MSKYQPLSDRLATLAGHEWRTTFSELEQVLGSALPKGARTGRAWWTGADKPHAKAWAQHGWEIGDLDHAAETVVFRRGAASAATLQQAADLKPLENPDRAAPPQAPAAPAALQPPTMTETADTAPGAGKLPKGVGVAALLAGGVAVVAGIGAFALRGVMRRK